MHTLAALGGFTPRISHSIDSLDLVEDLHGHRVADPYRWLEDVSDPRTVAWRAAQRELADEALGALPGRALRRGRD